MDVVEQIKRFQEFIQDNYYPELLENIRTDQLFLTINFSELSKYDPDLATDLLDNPEETIKAAETAVKQFDLQSDLIKARFSNLPQSQKVMIKNIRSKHLGKFIWVDGAIRQKSNVRPQVTSARFECPNCGNIMNVLQLEEAFKEPSKCGCGRKGKFLLLGKELVDAQGIVLEEASENLEGGAQPQRINIFLKDDLVSPMSEKHTSPGNKIVVVGMVKEVPIISKTGAKSTRFDLMLEANYVEAVQETFYEVEISEEEEAQIKEIGSDPKCVTRLVGSMAPSIYGYERIKEALLYQMMGGTRKTRQDNVTSRGDMHILLIGDPGAGKCTHGSTRIILESGEITTMEDFYKKYNSFVRDSRAEKIFSINQHGSNLSSQPTRFWRRKAPSDLFKIITNSGNEIIVTKEHPLFTTNNGVIFAKEAFDFKVGDYIATPSKIDVKGSLQGISLDIKHTQANNKKKYSCKEVLDADFARYLGYLTGDGCVRFNKTTGVIRFTNSNRDLLDDFENLTKRIFNCNISNKIKKNNCEDYRWFSTDVVRILQKINPNIIGGSGFMSFPSAICKSPNYVLKEFIKALFDCEGHIRKGRREIEFSSKSKDLIYELKYMLLRFGIISQVSSMLKCATNTKNKIKREYYRLRISGEDVIKYGENIGFISNEKKTQLNVILENKIVVNTNINIVPNIREILKILRIKYNLKQSSFSIPRSTYQHYERGDRYPSYNKLKLICQKYNQLEAANLDPLVNILNQISNSDVFWDGIKSIEEIKNDTEYVYDLEIEDVHNFVANGVVIHNSALLKRVVNIAPKGRYVSGKGVSLEFNEPLLIKEGGKIKLVKIGEFVDKYSQNKENLFIPLKENIKALSLNKTYKKLEWKNISHVFRHKYHEKLLKFELESGREVTVTKDHSIYILENGKLIPKKSQELTEEDYVLIPKHVPKIETNDVDEDYARLLGYFIADGHLHAKQGHYYKIEFTLGTKDTEIIEDLKQITQKKFNKKISIRKHHTNCYRLTINGKEPYEIFVKLLGRVTNKKAKEKRVPTIIFDSNRKIRKAFIEAYIKGDYGVTKSKDLASDLEYLFLQDSIIASYTKKYCDNVTYIHKRAIRNVGWVYELKSPIKDKRYDNRYSRPPFKKFGGCVSKYFFKKMKTSKYSRVSLNSISNNMLLSRFNHIAQNVISSGKDLRQVFGNSILEYVGDHKSLFSKEKVGRQMLVSLTQEGDQLIDELVDFYTVLNSDVGFVKIKSIEEVENKHEFVYDISVPDNENFVGGFGGVICHNSGAGLTASVVRDEFMRGWSLEAGAMVLASDGVCMIDELDKMSHEDRSAMHEALENQTVSISKANIQATLIARTTVLAAANPKLGRFDPYDIIANQIDLPPALINRFDLIFAIKDLPDEKGDELKAKHILSLHQTPDVKEPEISSELLRKYISYARQKVNPQLSEEAVEEIQTFYLKMRMSGQSDGGVSTVPISIRQLEALVRMSEAAARARLSNTVAKNDALKAIDLLEYCLMQVGLDRETGKIDIDRIATGIGATERNYIIGVKEIIKELEAGFENSIPIEEIVKSAKEKGISSEKVDETIEKLKRSGDLFEPRRGHISKL
tara:strand:+ start:12583 stop:17358 length:4776 start_codon:yes stop_codon:yes gene_type:complete